MRSFSLRPLSYFTSLSLLIALASCGTSENKPMVKSETSSDKTEMSMVERGGYIVRSGACNDCHSPKVMTPQGPVPDTTKLLSGHPSNSTLPPIDPKATKPGGWILMAPDVTAFVGPWGISYAANLTSDRKTGIGGWTEEAFINTLRTGRHMGLPNGRPLLPPMPWSDIGKMSDNDLKAVFAYLQSLPPVNNPVPPPVAPTEVAKVK